MTYAGNLYHLFQKCLSRKLSFPAIFLIVALSASARVLVEALLLDNGGHVASLGTFGNYARFYLENLYYFTTLFILLATLVSSVVRESLSQTMNFGARLYPLVVMPPIIDRFFFGRIENYTYGAPEHFITNVATLSWGSGDTGYGISALVTLGVIATSSYVFLKTRSSARAFATALATSVVVMILSTPDLFFGKDKADYGFDYFLPTYYFFPFLVLLGALYRQQSADKCRAVLRNLRPLRSLMFALAALVGYATIPAPSQGFVLLTVPFYYLVFAVTAVLFAWWFSVAVNDVFDRKIDAISNKDRPVPRGTLSQREYGIIAAFFAFFALSFGAVINLTVFAIVLLFLALGVAYSAPPLRLRNTFLGHAVIGGAFVLSFLAGVFTMWEWDATVLFNEKNVLFYIILFLFSTTMSLTKDLKDVDADKRYGVKNLFTLLGRKRGKRAAALLVAIVINTPPFLTGMFSMLPVTAIVGALTGYLYHKKGDMRVAYVGGMLLLFYVFLRMYYW